MIIEVNTRNSKISTPKAAARRPAKVPFDRLTVFMDFDKLEQSQLPLSQDFESNFNSTRFFWPINSAGASCPTISIYWS